MFELYADKNKLAVRRREPVTSGSVNVYSIRFVFSAEWQGLRKTAVFRAGGKSASVLLDDTGEAGCVIIPWEVLTMPGRRLEAGVYGVRGGKVVLPTVWTDLGYIRTGAAPGREAQPPTPELWQQELERKGDRLGYTADGELGLYSGDKLLSAVQGSGGGEGGTMDHRLLSNRDAEKQHPVKAIDGLEEELRRIPAPAEPLANLELEELLK